MPEESASRMSSSGFLDKTVSDITHALERSIFSEEHARLSGVLQQIDPRVKLIALLGLIVVVALLRHLPVILGSYFLALVLAAVSQLPLRSFLKRTLIGIPLFAAVVALPSLFMIPGQELIGFQLTEGVRLAISDNGLHSAALLVARVAASVSLALLLVLTTRWADLLKSLQALHVPQAFVMVLGMTYRYLFLLLHLTNDMFLARASRTVGRTTGGQDRRWVAATGGALVGKSLKMSEDVYMAMVSRGFAGEIRSIDNFKTRDGDWLFAGMVLVLASVALMVDRGLG